MRGPRAARTSAHEAPRPRAQSRSRYVRPSPPTLSAYAWLPAAAGVSTCTTDGLGVRASGSAVSVAAIAAVHTHGRTRANQSPRAHPFRKHATPYGMKVNFAEPEVAPPHGQNAAPLLGRASARTSMSVLAVLLEQPGIEQREPLEARHQLTDDSLVLDDAGLFHAAVERAGHGVAPREVVVLHRRGNHGGADGPVDPGRHLRGATPAYR